MSLWLWWEHHLDGSECKDWQTIRQFIAKFTNLQNSLNDLRVHLLPFLCVLKQEQPMWRVATSIKSLSVITVCRFANFANQEVILQMAVRESPRSVNLGSTILLKSLRATNMELLRRHLKRVTCGEGFEQLVFKFRLLWFIHSHTQVLGGKMSTEK